MRIFILSATTAALLAGPAAADERGEADIAKALAGRIAGKPITCIYQRDIRSTQIVANTAILYEMRSGTILLNRPPNGTAFLRSNLALVTDTHDGDRLCNVDIVRLYDTVSRFDLGAIGLGDFVPYDKPKS